MFISISANAQYWPRFIHIFSVESLDPDTLGHEHYWTITAGNTNKVFAIMPCSGDVRVDSLVYDTFITSKTFYLTIRSTDAGGLYAITKRKVTLKKTAGKRSLSVVSTL